jgi:hypothetical protein
MHVYWQIGRDISERQHRHGWGANVVNQLSDDLRKEFPGMKGVGYVHFEIVWLFSYPPYDLLYAVKLTYKVTLMMTEPEFKELLRKLENLGLRDGDLGYRYWYGVQQDLKDLWSGYKTNLIKK